MKRIISLITILSLLIVINSQNFGAVVSDQDGSAFITKAEFDSLKNNFQAQVNNYNVCIDSKIDGAIASYLSGLRVSTNWNKNSLDYSKIRFLNSNFSNKMSEGKYTLMLVRQANIDGYNKITVSGGDFVYETYDSIVFKFNYGMDSRGRRYQYPAQMGEWSVTRETGSVSQDATDIIRITPQDVATGIKIDSINGFLSDMNTMWIDFVSNENDYTSGSTRKASEQNQSILFSGFETVTNHIKAGLGVNIEFRLYDEHEIYISLKAIGDFVPEPILDLETDFINSSFSYNESTPLSYTDACGLIAKNNDNKYYINSYANIIETIRSLNVTQHTYLNHASSTYKTNGNAYTDDTASDLTINDSAAWGEIVVGSPISLTQKGPNANYYVASNYLQVIKDTANTYNMFQWGKIPVDTVTVYDSKLENDVGDTVTISQQSWDRNGKYMNNGAVTDTIGNKVKTKQFTFKKNHPKYISGNKIDYYYSEGLSQLGAGDVKIGGGLPFADNSGARDSSKVTMRFDIYDSSDVLANAQNLHWMISNKQFVSGGFDSAASVKLEGDSTGGAPITAESFATDSNTILWLNVYAETPGSYVKIANLSVE